ncbi:hypothetical protein [Bradyrhizobium tropiciagri]|uniref:hypothetical protein n=1 Tax=Bradyrhizobium tropiciagri TaxID=312253 RepID=UPI00067B9020|nr:hypothetical protein [Bradyrhizobium tropiciagri]
MRSRWLELIAFLLVIFVEEPAMAENLTVSEETGSEIATLVAAQAAAWDKGNAEAFCDRALPDISFTNIFGMFSVGKAPFVANMSEYSRPFTRVVAIVCRSSTSRWSSQTLQSSIS